MAESQTVQSPLGGAMVLGHENVVGFHKDFDAQDPKQRWIFNSSGQMITSASNSALVLGVDGSDAVIQEPNSCNNWQNWQLSGKNIVNSYDLDICLQIADKGDGNKIVIGVLKNPVPKYQQWILV